MVIFSAVALLLTLMNGLFFFILKDGAGRLMKFSRRNLMHQANIYDELIENREAELRALLLKIEEAKARVPAAVRERRVRRSGDARSVSGILSLLGGVPGPGDFAENYALLRNSVLSDTAFCAKAALKQAAEAAGEEKRGPGNPAAELLAALDTETTYGLCLLGSKEAFCVMEETLRDEGQRELLREYLAEGGESVAGFRSDLAVKAFMRNPRVAIRTGNKEDEGRDGLYGEGATVEYDGSICEGLYAIAGGRLYDYSVRNGDVNG
jgi:hypothetical protein